MQCKAITSDGKKCGGFALRDSSYCFAHNPDKKQEHIEAARKGGEATVNRDYIRLAQFPVDDASSALYMISDTIDRVRLARPDGSFDLRTANSIGFLVSKLLECRKQLLYEEEQIMNSICKDRKIDIATFRQLMREYDQEYQENAAAFIAEARKRYEQFKEDQLQSKQGELLNF